MVSDKRGWGSPMRAETEGSRGNAAPSSPLQVTQGVQLLISASAPWSPEGKPECQIPLLSPHLTSPPTTILTLLLKSHLSLSQHKPSLREPIPSSPDNKTLEVAAPRRLHLPLHLHMLSTLKPNDCANTAATFGLLPGTIAAGCQLQWACVTIPYSFHKALAPQREHPNVYCKCLP